MASPKSQGSKSQVPNFRRNARDDADELAVVAEGVEDVQTGARGEAPNNQGVITVI